MINVTTFLGDLYNCKKCLLASSCLSTCIHVAPTGWISVKFYVGNCMKMCWQTPYFVRGVHFWHFTWRPKYVLLLLVTDLPENHFYATFSIFMLLTVTYI